MTVAITDVVLRDALHIFADLIRVDVIQSLTFFVANGNVSRVRKRAHWVNQRFDA
ncbi:hypothetical protein HIN56_13960, partial [Salmonella enterica subsp. enterica serovar Choleraesuis]|nr:hypothetical protein [Salmonella enterica subsp. enterica serovar Choleraesuis]